jgi:type IV pilus assembly protein PilY1
VRTSTNNPVDWNSKNGWYMDFPTGGERSSTDPTLALGTLLFTTITPQASTVSACGSATGSSASFLYALDYLTGGPVDGASGVIGISLGSGIATRPVVIEQADGTVRALIRTSSGAAGDGTDLGNTISITPKVKQTGAAGTRRVSWRVLNAQ